MSFFNTTNKNQNVYSPFFSDVSNCIELLEYSCPKKEGLPKRDITSLFDFPISILLSTILSNIQNLEFIFSFHSFELNVFLVCRELSLPQEKRKIVEASTTVEVKVPVHRAQRSTERRTVEAKNAVTVFWFWNAC